MTPQTVPATSLEQFLLLNFSAPPDAKTVSEIASVYKTTPEVVQSAVRQFVPQRSVAPPAVLRPRGFDTVASAFRQHGHVLKPTKKGFITRCPFHQDRRPSLQISRAPDDGRVALLRCHSCKRKAAELLPLVGLRAADCFPDDRTACARPMREIVTEYPYVMMAGDLVATKARYRDRFSGKQFGWRVGNRWRLTDSEKAVLPLYRERDLIEESTVYLVEGEKAADRLWEAGLPATCGPHGAGTWEPRWTESLRLLGAQHVVILTDHDAAGSAHGELVASALHANQIDVRVVALPNLVRGEDVYDWLVGGGTVEDLEAIVASTTAWSPGLAERQRIERQQKRWREKKQRQRQKRRERVPLCSSDTRDVPLRSQERQDVPPVPLSPLRSISIVTSKEVDSRYVSSDVEALSETREGGASVIEISTSICREIHQG